MKTVLITGGNSGLGLELVKKYSKNNYNVIFTYLNHEKDANILLDSLKNELHIKAIAIKCDLSKEEDINNLFQESIKNFNKIDILINNAGIAVDTEFNTKTKENFLKILDVNLVGPFLLSRLIGNHMLENKSGTIINISSTNGINTYYEYSLDYDASKAGLINLSHNLANHYAPYIRVNTVCPGWINTPMNKCLDKDYKKKEENKILLKRFAQPEEIANVVYFLSTEEASYINNAVIKVDGGNNVSNE